MSFNAKSPAVFDRQLKVQEVCVTASDTQIYDANGGNGKFDMGESVAACLLVVQKDDSANDLVHFAAADISVSGTEITVTGLALAANDVAIVKYVVAD